MLKKAFLFIAIVIEINAIAQPLPFKNEIDAFKRQDSEKFPPLNATLFVGSSSIRLWPDLQHAFPNQVVINRGFGGSGLQHLIQYANDIIFPYHPKQIVIYSGENDLAMDNVTAEWIENKVKELYMLIRKKLPETRIVFIAMKPSPSREAVRSEIIEANKRIANFISKQHNTFFVNVFPLMFDAKGKERTDLFKQDMLHMNEKGYAIWEKAIEPYLLK